MKNILHIIILIYIEKTFDKHLFKIKNFQQSKYRGNVPHIIKAMYVKSTTNIILRNKTRIPMVGIFIQIILEVLAREIMSE